jgi:GMP reductase
MKQLFDFDDVLIEPAVITNIRTRGQIKCRLDSGELPLMTAPMDTVIDKTNYKLFKNNGLIPVLPRTKDTSLGDLDNDYFLSLSMVDFEKLFLHNTPDKNFTRPFKVLIDVANGHMKDLIDLTIKSKKKYGNDIKLMVGNVAHPETFYEYMKTGVDFVRIGIGNGNGCLTTVQTGIGYPMASLISDCFDIREKYTQTLPTKIVADGGFKKYSDIIKALGLGADYVMLGSILNKCLESSGETSRVFNDDQHIIIDQYSPQTKEMFDVGIPIFKHFRGMSTKEVQKSLGKEVLTTSEGVIKTQKVEYTIKGWVDNMESYLKSAMSYTGKKNIYHFIGGVHFNHITMNSFNRFNK